MSNEDLKNLCQCAKCGTLVNEPKLIKHNYAGVIVNEKVCPNCEGNIRLIELPEWMDKYLYINNDNKYYTY